MSEVQWIDEEVPDVADASADQSIPPSGKGNEAGGAAAAWQAGWDNPWKRPDGRPPGPPSILRRGGIDAGPWRGAAGILAGAGAVGKSWAALDLAVKVAAGPDLGVHTWCGFDVVASGRVVYVAAEDPGNVLDGRLFDLTEQLSPAQRSQLEKRLTVVSLADESPELLRVWRLSRQMEPDEATAAGVSAELVTGDDGAAVRLRSPSLSETRVLPSDLLVAMRRSLSGAGVVLVVLDPLARLGGSDAEGDNAVAARLMRELGGLADEAGAAVLVVHHTTKAARKAGDADGTGVRGASALMDGARWAAELHGLDDETVRLSVTKTSYGRGVLPIYLRRESWGGLRPETAAETAEREAAREAAEEAPKKKRAAKQPKGSPSGKDKAAGQTGDRYD